MKNQIPVCPYCKQARKIREFSCVTCGITLEAPNLTGRLPSYCSDCALEQRRISHAEMRARKKAEKVWTEWPEDE